MNSTRIANQTSLESLRKQLTESGVRISHLSQWTVNEHGFHCDQQIGKNPLQDAASIARKTYIKSVDHVFENQCGVQIHHSHYATLIYTIVTDEKISPEMNQLIHHCCNRFHKSLEHNDYPDTSARHSEPSKRAGIVNEILNTIARSESILDDRETAKMIAQHLKAITLCENLIIASLGDDKKSLDALYYSDEQDESRFPFEVDEAFVDGSIAAFVSKFGKPIRGSSIEILNGLGVSTDPAYGTHSSDIVGVPIKSASNIFGAIIVQSYQASFKFSDHIPSILAIVADSIAHKAEQLEVKHYLDGEVDNKTRSLESKNKQLEETIKILDTTRTELAKSEAQSYLSNIVLKAVHSLNTPIGNVKTSTSIISDIAEQIESDSQHLTEAKLGDSIEDLKSACSLSMLSIDKASSVINEFKRLTARDIDYSKTLFSTNELFSSLELLAAPLVSNTDVVLKMSGDDVLFKSYFGAISELLLCLIDNSVKHAFAGMAGKITLSTSMEKDLLQINYRDNGVGVDSEIKNNLFDLFESSKAMSGSLGLGLPIVKNIVNNIMAGTIELTDEDKNGFCVEIKIPVEV